MENKELNYKTAYEELQTILNDIENNNTDLDILSEKLKRANELILFCKDKLVNIETDVEKLIAEIEEA